MRGALPNQIYLKGTKTFVTFLFFKLQSGRYFLAYLMGYWSFSIEFWWDE